MSDFDLLVNVLSHMAKLTKRIHNARRADIMLSCNAIRGGENSIAIINNGECEARDVEIKVTNFPKHEVYWDESPFETQNVLCIPTLAAKARQEQILQCWRIQNEGRLVVELEIHWRDKRKEEQYKIIKI